MAADKLTLISSTQSYRTIKDPAAAGARTKGVPEIFKGLLVFPFDSYAAGVDHLLIFEAEQVEANATVLNTVLAQVSFLNGDLLFWDAAASKLTNVPGQNTPIGRCLKANDLSAAVPAGSTLLLQLLGDLRLRTRSGQSTTVTASDTIATGLTKVLSVVANLEDAPVIGCDRAQALIGDQAGTPAAGSILIKTYKPTASGDATPIAATTFSKKVNWVATGY